MATVAVVGKKGKRRGFSSWGVDTGEGSKKNPFSFMDFFSAASTVSITTMAPFSLTKWERLKGLGMRGVMGLRTSVGKSRMLGERTLWCFLGKNDKMMTLLRRLMLGFLLNILVLIILAGGISLSQWWRLWIPPWQCFLPRLVALFLTHNSQLNIHSFVPNSTLLCWISSSALGFGFFVAITKLLDNSGLRLMVLMMLHYLVCYVSLISCLMYVLSETIIVND